MSTSSLPLVIIGTGLAGYTLAREWRKLDRERPLVMITADDGAFYSKPMLSNGLAQGKTPDTLAMKSASDMAEDLAADIRTGTTVDEIDIQGRTLTADGTALAYGDLVIAVGATPIRIPVEGDGADAVLSVNGLEDYRRFRDALENAGSVAVMGPGLIGCEFANDLVSQGTKVQVFGPDPWPISTLLPETSGNALRAALENAGVTFHLDTTAERIDTTETGYRLTLKNGDLIEADLVLSAVGLRPDTKLAESAGLDIKRGIVTDNMLRTNADHIYALGDCAEVAGLNLPFVMPIMHGARALAKTLAGEPTAVSYPPMPVVIKTPALATVVAPPPKGAEGNWKIEGETPHIRALFEAPDGTLLGFALTGTAAAEKQTLTKALPATL